MSGARAILVALVLVLCSFCRSPLAGETSPASGLRQSDLSRASGLLQVQLLESDLPLAALDEVRAAPASQWRDFGDGAPRPLPFRDRGSWLRIVVPPGSGVDRVLVVTSLVAGPVTLVLPDGGTIRRSKLEPELGSSALALDFPLGVEPASRTLLMFFEHQHRALTRLELMPTLDWQRRDRATFALVCSLYAAMTAFAVIAFCYWAILRERMFADYTIYLVGLLAFMASNSGVLYAIPGLRLIGALGIHGQWALVSITIGCAIGFAAGFVDVARHLPRFAGLFEGLRTGFLVAAAVMLLSPWPLAWFGMAVVVVLFFSNLAMLAIGIAIARAGDRYAWYFLAGWFPLTVSTTLRALHSAGVVPHLTGIEHLYAVGAVWEALVLTLGIADRVLAFRRERDLARSAAEQDPLTGVLNRRALEARLRALAAEAREGGSGFALLFIDIDHFKQVNDRHGHACGDQCLVAAAQRIGAELRGGDFVARYGGEEFVVLLAGAGLEDARRVAEQIRQRVAAEAVGDGGDAVAITVSIGVAVFDRTRDDVGALLRRADAALYRAKSEGRNRVMSTLAAA